MGNFTASHLISLLKDMEHRTLTYYQYIIDTRTALNIDQYILSMLMLTLATLAVQGFPIIVDKSRQSFFPSGSLLVKLQETPEVVIVWKQWQSERQPFNREGPCLAQ